MAGVLIMIHFNSVHRLFPVL